MTMQTEALARTRWCPFGRVVVIHDDANTGEGWGTANRGRASTPCIATQCMAWRWSDSLDCPPEVRRGFCGLAGEPVRP